MPKGYERSTECLSYEEEIAIYRTAVIDCKDKGLTRDRAKEIAKNAVYHRFPYLKTETPTNPRFWTLTSSVLQQYYPKSQEEQLFQTPIPARKGERPIYEENFMEFVRRMAGTGFVPYGRYLEPIIGQEKARQLSSYISQACDGKFSAEKNGYGWICTPIIKPRTVDDVAKDIRDAAAVGDWKKLADLLIELQTMKTANKA